MARKQQQPKDMNPDQYGFPQFPMPFSPSHGHHMPVPFNHFPSFGGMPYVNPNGAPFVMHPFAGDLARSHALAKRDDINGNADGRRPRGAVNAPLDDDSKPSAAERLCAAARKLHEQIKESIEIYKALQEFDQEVKEVKGYVGKHILQQMWAKKVEKFQNDKTEELPRKKLSNQQEYLTELLDETDAAAQDLLPSLQLGRHQYDCRKTILDQIQQAGDRVRESSGKASTNKDAYDDLMKDLRSIKAMTHPKTSAIYGFEKPDVEFQDQEDVQDDNDDDA
ncbi:hypothetical protein PG985_012431 [Apiospora marii]|uniref:Uncharacterized protein n=1 Tax=Apiospora marii TaxID=335849 RepID=A0ABR1RDM1_9PEZI